ncbi:hypothetical protein WKI65_42935 [Streptomyces sp. MS1.AVA.3]|uniref:hypothetical protein n=1 Tax=Streptomyces decoyicus TaxID=249567 RepID=UPI0030BFA22A
MAPLWSAERAVGMMAFMARNVDADPLPTADSVRRWFSVAAWGSAAGYPLLALALSPLVMEVSGASWGAVRSVEGGVAALTPVGGIVGYLTWQAMSSVRSARRALTERARDLVAASQKGDPELLETAAEHFSDALLTAYTDFNTRILPRRIGVSLARQVHSEARGEGLGPSTLCVINDLAGVKTESPT